jgi:hypothetical protein
MNEPEKATEAHGANQVKDTQEKQRTRVEIRILRIVLAISVPVLTILLTVNPSDLRKNVDAYRIPVIIGLAAVVVAMLAGRLFTEWQGHNRRDRELRRQLESVEEERQHLALENVRLATLGGQTQAAPIIHHFHAKRERTQIIFDALAAATDTIDVVGVANEMVTIDVDEGFFTEFFDRGGRMRVLFIDPEGDAVKQREIQEKWPPGHLSIKAAANIARLKLYSNAESKLQVRLYDHIPTVNMLLIDRRWALVHHYGWAAHGTETPTIEIDDRVNESAIPDDEISKRAAQIRSEIMKYYNSEYNVLWSLAKPYELF